MIPAQGGNFMATRREELNQGFRVAGKTARPLQGRIETATRQVRLEPRVMDLLVYLAELRGQVVTRDAIIRDVWRGVLVSDDVISRSVYLIRKALNDGNESGLPSSIETIPKRGYRLIAEVIPLTSDAETHIAGEGAAETPPPAPPLATPVAVRRRFAVAPWFAVTAVLLGVFLLGSVWISRTTDPALSQPPSIIAGDKLPPEHHDPGAIVVLPFSSEGDATQTPYIGSGLTDSIVTGLGSVQDLRVIGGFSAIRAQAGHESYADIARDLHVSTVLEGRVATHGKNITLDTRLVNVKTGQAFWEKNYAVNLGMSGALQADVVDDVARALGISVGDRVEADEHRHEPNPDAYRLFLQGRSYAQQNSPGGYQQAHDYFSQAVKVDPQFARAWAALAVSNMLMVDFGNRSRESATAEAEPAVKRALELDRTLAEAQGAAGLVALYNHRFEESAQALRRATALRPSYAQGHMWLGRLFVGQNQVRRAGAAYELAYELEPQNPMVGLNLGMTLDVEGHYDNAMRVLQETLVHDPKLANLHWAYAQLLWDRGELGDAAAEYRSAIELGAEYAELFANYAVLLADMGDFDGALTALSHVASIDSDKAAVWAARADIAATSSRYSELIDSIVEHSLDRELSFWPALAAAKLELARAKPDKALLIYEQAGIEQRMTEETLRGETKFLGGPSAILDLACAYQWSGNKAHAERLVERAESAIAADRDRGINPNLYDYLMAAAASMRGDQQHALALLRVANERGWHRYSWFKIDPRFRQVGDRTMVLAQLNAQREKIARSR
jgi:DNA-binding winged helix-turn-helix (wHTH) protein/TolB-like protein/tetratricopeptide (TPR) repeat protein